MRKQIHASSLRSFYECGEQFRRRYVLGDREPDLSTVAQCVGNAVDNAVTVNLNHVLRSGNLLSVEDVAAMAVDYVERKFDADDIVLTPTQERDGLDRVRAAAVRKAATLTTLHCNKVAPYLKPTAVQYPFSIDVDSFLNERGLPTGYDLVGTMDVTERFIIRDTKTRDRAPEKGEADDSVQLTCYALQHYVEHGRLPDAVILDVLANVRGGEYYELRSTRTMENIGAFLDDVAHMVACIDKERFEPKPSWKCKMCDFRFDCEHNTETFEENMAAKKAAKKAAKAAKKSTAPQPKPKSKPEPIEEDLPVEVEVDDEEIDFEEDGDEVELEEEEEEVEEEETDEEEEVGGEEASQAGPTTEDMQYMEVRRIPAGKDGCDREDCKAKATVELNWTDVPAEDADELAQEFYCAYHAARRIGELMGVVVR